MLLGSSTSHVSLFGISQLGSISPEISTTKQVFEIGSRLNPQKCFFLTVFLQNDWILGIAIEVVLPAPEAAQTNTCPSFSALL